jgi:hypothetical protein
MCRSARFGLISPRLIKRRTVIVETPPKYLAASFILSAPIDAELLLFMTDEVSHENNGKKQQALRLSLLIIFSVCRASLC